MKRRRKRGIEEARVERRSLTVGKWGEGKMRLGVVPFGWTSGMRADEKW